MELLKKVCEECNLNVREVFKLAAEYEQMIQFQIDFEKYFMTYCRYNKSNKLMLVILPDFVEKFCEEMLAHKYSYVRQEHIGILYQHKYLN